jgi:phosphatidylserine synthase
VRAGFRRVPSVVLDRALRPWKRRLYAPVTRALAGWPADAVTLAAAGIGLLAALLAAAGRFDLALLAWWTNRLLDGLDGELARAASRPAAGAGAHAARRQGSGGAAQRGAYLDLMGDLLVYAALPLGLAAGAAGAWTGSAAAPALAGSWTVWAAAAAALAAFYLNLGSWSLLAAALAEAEGPQRGGDATVDPGVRMPAGLMEGTETIVAFSVALLWPAGAVWTLATIAALTLVGALHRSWWGAGRLALVARP